MLLDKDTFNFSMYLITKFIVYSIWCGYAFYYFNLSKYKTTPVLWAGYFGVIRVILGFIVGLLFLMISTSLSVTPLIFILPLLAPVILIIFRWTEWWLMEAIIKHQPPTNQEYFHPAKRSRNWRLIGICVSFFADFISIYFFLSQINFRIC